MNELGNILDPSSPDNFRFLASIIASLCEDAHLEIDLSKIKPYFETDEIGRLQYTLSSNFDKGFGKVVFSLKENQS